MRQLQICGTGHYLPRRVVSNEEIASLCGVSAGEVFLKSGVHSRHRADRRGGETATEMGAMAARRALEAAGMKPGELGLIVNASGTPEQALPDNSALIQQHLGLGGSGIPCMSVSSTCLSFLSALDVVSSFLATGRVRSALIVSSDVASVGIDHRDVETAGLFGDGAAAVVVAQAPEGSDSALRYVQFSTFGNASRLTEIPGCGSRLPPGEADTPGDAHLFRMDGRRLMRLVLAEGPSFLKKLVAEVPEVAEDTTLVIPHQPSRAGMAMMRSFGFGEERTVSILPELGNCVAASLPLALDRAIAQKRLRRGGTALLVGTAAGVSLGAAVLTY